MSSGRIAWMDLTRFLAMATVVALHTTDQLMQSQNNLNELQWIIYQTFRIIGRTAVPIFVMISGALVLPKISNISVFEFYKKRIPQFFLVLIFYFYVTNIIVSLLDHSSFTFSNLESRLFRGDTFHAYQLWFMFTIIGLYFIAPFVGRMMSILSNKEIYIYLGLCVIANYLSVSQTIIFGSHPFYTQFGSEFLGTYLAYFIVGYLIHNRGVAKNISIYLIMPLLLIAIAIILYIQLYLKNLGQLQNNEGFTWYDSLGIFIASSLIFALLSKIEDSSLKFFFKPLRFLSASSFCVYLFHLIPLEVFKMMPSMTNHNVIISSSMITCATYLCGLIFYIALYKIKYIRNLVI